MYTVAVLQIVNGCVIVVRRWWYCR